MTFAGKSAIVTGAAQGIGLAVARRLIDADMTVTMVDRNPDVMDVAGDLGASASGAVVDLCDV
ncbi:MAG: SDR family NAD(P)-dependent oxidoreductase, partial [Actinobacteria bacterium]|nr:SDR family NAD(P)-dependent oxidoreductase [Actinomycetota bacterium]